MQNTHQFGPSQPAYRPTSLDFINRPNPVEPHTDPHKHPLHADQNHLRLLHDNNAVGLPIGGGEPPRKRRKSAGGRSHDLGRPTLPAVPQQGEKRLRIPPTLSGLHQPPPDAGILPSISINGLRSVELPERTAVPPQQIEPAYVSVLGTGQLPKSSEQSADQAGQDSASETAGAASSVIQAKSRKNKKWTEIETKCLLKGVERHGIGSWTKILKDPDLSFDDRRNALDLKDRFRVCCPDQYKTSRKAKVSETSKAVRDSQLVDLQKERPKRTRATDRKTEAELRDLGVATVFTKSVRRKRTGYSEAEDDAILEGFRKYGQKWSQIQQDEDLGLESRKPMDLRDRMRNRWPEEYAKAGLKLRAEKGSRGEEQAKTKEDTEEAPRGDSNEMQAPARSSAARIVVPHIPRPEKENKETTITVAPTKNISASFLNQIDDVFWGLPLDADEERVTLDRRILDWPLDLGRNTTSSNIDPLSTLNLPRPNALPTMSVGVPFQSASSAAATLPSLTSVTAGSLPFDFGEQLELPSLLEGFGALEDGNTDSRAGAQFMPSLDELLG